MGWVGPGTGIVGCVGVGGDQLDGSGWLLGGGVWEGQLWTHVYIYIIYIYIYGYIYIYIYIYALFFLKKCPVCV